MQTKLDSIFEELYADHFHRLEIQAYTYLNDWNDAHEVAQATMRLAWLKYDEFAASPNPEGWLTRSAQFISLNEGRARQRRRKFLASLDILPDEQMPYTLDPLPEDPLAEFKGLVSESDLHILARFFVDELSCRDVASELGIGEDACYKRIQRAAIRFRKAYFKKYKKING